MSKVSFNSFVLDTVSKRFSFKKEPDNTMCRYPSQPRLTLQPQPAEIQQHGYAATMMAAATMAAESASASSSAESSPLAEEDLWGADDLLAGLTSAKVEYVDVSEPVAVDASTADAGMMPGTSVAASATYDWVSADDLSAKSSVSSSPSSAPNSVSSSMLSSNTSSVSSMDLTSMGTFGDPYATILNGGGFLNTPTRLATAFEWPLPSPLVTPSIEATTSIASIVQPLAAPAAPVAAAAPTASSAAPMAPAIVRNPAAPLVIEPRMTGSSKAGTSITVVLAPRISKLAPVPAATNKRPHHSIASSSSSDESLQTASSGAAAKKRGVASKSSSNDTWQPVMPVIDYVNMTPEEIQKAKRERNRLAAEKYRRKGRDLIEKLQIRCEELMNENESLKAAMSEMAEELRVARDFMARQQHQ